MISPTYRKIIQYGLALIGIVIIMTMPDVVMGFLFELVHFFFELLFIIFEWVESTLDKVVEHLFDTELHETQTIVFYLMVGIVLLPLYYLWRMLLRLFFWLKNDTASNMDTKQNPRYPFLAGLVFNRQNQMDCNYGRRNLPGFFSIHVICTMASKFINFSAQAMC